MVVGTFVNELYESILIILLYKHKKMPHQIGYGKFMEIVHKHRAKLFQAAKDHR